MNIILRFIRQVQNSILFRTCISLVLSHSLVFCCQSWGLQFYRQKSVFPHVPMLDSGTNNYSRWFYASQFFISTKNIWEN